jgi:hypothetical protein
MREGKATGLNLSRLLKKPASKAAGESKPEAYPQGYVEDFDEPRTKLEGFFSSLLCRETRGLPIDHPHSCENQCNAKYFTHAYGFVQ